MMMTTAHNSNISRNQERWYKHAKCSGYFYYYANSKDILIDELCSAWNIPFRTILKLSEQEILGPKRLLVNAHKNGLSHTIVKVEFWPDYHWNFRLAKSLDFWSI